MRQDKKAARLEARIEALLKSRGVDPDEIPVEVPARLETRQDIEREATAVLNVIQQPQAFRQVMCPQCQRFFLVNYSHTNHCSSKCNAAALAQIGIRWNPDRKPEERWSGVPPLFVGPDALEALKKLLFQSPTKIPQEVQIQEPLQEAEIQAQFVELVDTAENRTQPLVYSQEDSVFGNL